MKTLILISTVVVVAGLLLVWLSPTSIDATSTITIQVPAKVAYGRVADMGQYHTWSPWLQTDPLQKHYATGVPATVGNQYHWEGVAKKSLGTQTIVALVPNELVAVDCQIKQPFQSNPQFKYSFAETEGGQTQVRLAFTTQLPRPFNAVALLMGLGKEIATVNDQAMANLKAVCESQQVAAHLTR